MHSTGALFELAHSTTGWYHDPDDGLTSSLSNAETITSTGLLGRPKHKTDMQTKLSYLGQGLKVSPVATVACCNIYSNDVSINQQLLA